MFRRSTPQVPEAGNALPGRTTPLNTAESHFVNGRPLRGPYPQGFQTAAFAMGCFWGAERIFWQVEGVWVTAVGYTAGLTPNPTYQEVCSGATGHSEAIMAVFDPAMVGFEALLKVFWENHDPTQGMRQGNDRGTQYRSGIYTHTRQQSELARASAMHFATQLARANCGTITTEILPASAFYFAEEDHQQYLAKNPGGYCGLGGTGVICPIGTEA